MIDENTLGKLVIDGEEKRLEPFNILSMEGVGSFIYPLYTKPTKNNSTLLQNLKTISKKLEREFCSLIKEKSGLDYSGIFQVGRIKTQMRLVKFMGKLRDAHSNQVANGAKDADIIIIVNTDDNKNIKSTDLYIVNEDGDVDEIIGEIPFKLNDGTLKIGHQLL